MDHSHSLGIRGLSTALLLLFLSGGLVSTEAQGLAVRLAPQASSLRWADDVGLDNDLFYGGGLALGFGRFVSLHGSYRFANALQTSLGATDYDGGMASENVLDAELFSTGVEVRIGSAMFAPVVTGTGGVLQMSPEGRENVKQVVVGYGGGLDARIRPWLNGQLLVEDLRFRLDRSTLARDEGGGVAPDQDRNASRRSTSLTLSLGARLGGGRSSARANALDQDMTRVYSGEGLMVRAELTGGVIRFDNALLLSERPYFGVRGGLDFGPFFGVRGTYAQGTQRDLGGFVGMTTWSGEAQFNVGRVTDWSTHILLGFGQISFDSDFLDTSGATPDDQNAVIVGAGVGIPVGSRAQILVSLRDHITTVGEISGVSTPNDLRHNFGLSTGLSFLVSGAPSRPGPSGTGPTAIPRAPEPVEAPPTDLDVPDVAEQEVPEPQLAPDSVDVPMPTPSALIGDSARVAASTPTGSAGQDTLSSGRPENYQSERVISFPIPTEGEVFIRYGPPPTQAAAASPTISQPRPDTAGAPGAAVAPDTAAAPGAAAAPAAGAAAGQPVGVTTQDLAALESRLAARMDTLSRGASADTLPSATPTEPSPELEALRVQVEELAELVRQGALRGGGEPPADTTDAPDARGEPDTADAARPLGVTTDDLAALEQRLAARMDTLARGAPVDTTTPSATPAEPNPELEALRRQVEDLTQLVREGALGGGGTQVIPVMAGPGEEVVTELRDPFFQGVELRVGGSSVRDAGPGVSLAIDALFGDRVLGPLQPFAGLHVSEVGVDGNLAGTAYGGSVTSYGMSTGVRFGLPEVRSVEPTLSLGVSGLTGGTRGDSPTEADVVESIYGGFVMGPKIALTGAWRRTPDARLQVVGTVGRLWAGPRGGWTIQAGVRWSRPPQEETFVRPLRSAARPSMAPGPTGPEAEAPTDPPAVRTDSLAVDAERDALLTRLDTLEASLRQEQEARQQLEAQADSAAAAQAAEEASARAEQARLLAAARADSLAALSDSLAELERQQTEAREAEANLETGLRELLGVVPSVQSVRRADGSLVVVLGGSLFPTGATSLGPETRPAVERVAQIVAEGPVEGVVVSGHTDATGSADTNLRISRLRAEAVRAVLIDVGVPAEITEVVASGEQQPVASNDTPEGRRQNRRVEILIRTASPGG